MSEAFRNQLISTALSMLGTFVVAAISYIIAKRYERGVLAYREMVYIERFYNTYLSRIQTARSTISNWRKTTAKGQGYYLSFEEFPLRFESTINLLDLDLAQACLAHHTDAERLNHDYQNLTRWNEEIRKELLRTQDFVGFNEAIKDLSLRLDNTYSYLELFAQRIMRTVCRDRIKMASWKRRIWFSTSSLKDVGFYKMLMNNVLHPNTVLTEEDITKEKECLRNEMEAGSSEEREQMKSIGLEMREPSI